MWQKKMVLSTLVAMVAVVITLLSRGAEDMWILNAIISLLVTEKLMLVNSLPVGHGVNGMRHVCKFPAAIFPFYALFLLCGIGLTLISSDSTLLLSTIARVHATGVVAIVGVLAGVIEWYAFSHKETYYVSESQERHLLKAKGLSDANIEELIREGRAHGFFGPQK